MQAMKALSYFWSLSLFSSLSFLPLALGGSMLKRVFLGAFTALLLPLALGAQDRQISGRVTQSGTDQPIENAAVMVAGTSRASVRTDAQGQYNITVPSGDVRLGFRAIGHTPRELPVAAGQSTLNVSMTRDAFRLGEVVVTGQATTVERRSATTASAYVSGEEVTKVAAPTFENALAGKVAGVNLQSNSGAPGGGIQMQVRGNNTILGAFDPLYVVDGIIYSNERIAGGRGAISNAAFAFAEDDAVNRTADINPADIASIEILKGAAASSIYGSKAANGVVIITTRRGQAGRPRMNVIQRFGLSQPTRSLESRRYTQAEAVTRYGAGVAQWFTTNANPYFNHYDQIFTSTDLSHETIADISGGTDATKYFVGGGWKRDEGIELNTGFSRGTLRANVDQRLGNRFDVRVSSVFNRSTHDRGWNNNCNNYACHGYAFPYTPSFVDISARDASGNFITPNWGIQSNTMQLSQRAVNHEDTYRFTGGANAGFDALQTEHQTLRLVAGLGIDAFQQNNDLWSPSDLFHERPAALPGEAIEQNGLSRFYNWNANAIHTFQGGAGWSLTTSGGLQYEDRNLNVSRIRAQNLLPGQRNVDQGTIQTATEDLTAERTVALYAQEEVRLLNELLLIQAAVRAERSSVNGDIDKYYVFPKVAGSYRWVDIMGSGVEIKPRIAYGETGNQPLYGQKFTLLNTPQLGGTLGFTVAGAAGFEDVEPERVKELEIGLDGTAFDGGLTWELTSFNRNTTNLLLQRVPAPSTGFTSQIFNGGKIRNTGFEVAIGYTPITTTSLQWVTRGTYTHYRSKVLDLAGLPPFRPNFSGFGGLGVTFIQVGQPLTQLIGRGFCEDYPGETCQNTIRTTRTDLKIGDTAPNYRMGFVNDVSWNAFNFSAVLDYQNGGSIINLTQFLYDDAQNAEDFGTPEYTARRRGLTNGVMAPYIESATFLKLREISIGYELPRFIVSRMAGVDNARINLTGRNLASWQKYSGLDPEVANLGSAAIRNNLDVAPYPPSRSFFFNIAVGF
jgi:TonB-linked SusC/RagA family outer membrane protein